MLTDHLPDWLSVYVQQTAEEMQVPVDSVAVLSLGAISAAINGGASVTPSPRWTEPVALYTLALLASGEGKSPVFARLMDPVINAFEEVTGVNQAVDSRYQTTRNRINRKAVKRVETAAMNKYAKGQMSLEEVVAEVAAAERSIQLFNSTATPIKIVTDPTPASLMDAFQDNNGRVVIATAEAEGLLNFKGGQKAALLSAYDGERITRTRKAEGEITITRPVMTMVVAMQPSVIGTIGSDMVNRGVMPRFLISYPESKMGFRDSKTPLTTPEAEVDYQAEMTRIVETYSGKAVKLVSFERAATATIGPWRREIEPMLRPGGDLASVPAWASKVKGGHFLRVAAILAIANGREMVTVADCENAKAILRALIIDAKRAFGEMGASFADDDLVHLMGLAKRFGPTFTRRQVMRGSNRFMTNPQRLGDALDRAVQEDLLGRKGNQYTLTEDDDE